MAIMCHIGSERGVTMAKKPKQAGIYVRISKDRNHKREGVTRQIEDCEFLCRMNGYEVYKIYEDNDISAHGTASKKAKERPQYKQMIKDFERGKIDVIVSWKLDRLTRDVAGFEAMLNQLATQNLCICTTDLGGSEQDLTRADTVLIAQIIAAFAQFEASRKGERTKRANKARAEKGIMNRGTRCFGYDRNNDIIPAEAEVVRAIYNAYAKGSSIGAISRAIAGDDDGTLPNFPKSEPLSVILAREQGKPIPDKKWGRDVTANILRNPKYAGYTYYAPTVNGKSCSYSSNWRDYLVRDDDGNIVMGTEWEPIVSEEIWWRVQERRDKNLVRADGTRIPKSGNPKKHIGAGVYRCGICGKPLKGAAQDRRKGKIHDHSYRCDGHVHRLGSKIDKLVLYTIEERLAKDDLKSILVREADNEPRIKEINDEISHLNAELAKTMDRYTRMSEADVEDDLLFMINEKIKLTRSKITQLTDEQDSLLPQNYAADIINAPDPVAAFKALTDPAQISKVIDQLMTVTVYPHPRGKRVTPESLAVEVKIEWKDKK